MRPIDGDRLKAHLDDVEKTLKGFDNLGRESWDIYVSAFSATFRVTREAIDRMPTLEIRDEG